MTWKDIIKKSGEGDRSDISVKWFDTAFSNFKSEYKRVVNDATRILVNAERGQFNTAPVWQDNFERFEEMVEGLKINMNRLTRMTDKEEEAMYRHMRDEDIE
jgi:hypothetical protein